EDCLPFHASSFWTIREIAAFAIELVASWRQRKRRSSSCSSSTNKHKMKITAVSELPELVELVHDYWFDVEKIVFDRARKSVTFRVEPKRAYVEAGSSKGIAIEIRNVEDLIVADTEKVGYYDINQITFDAGKNALLLTGGI